MPHFDFAFDRQNFLKSFFSRSEIPFYIGRMDSVTITFTGHNAE